MNPQSVTDLITHSAFSILVENLQQAVLLETPDRRIKLVNQAFCDLFRIPVPPDQLTGLDCSNAAEQAKELFARPAEFISRITVLLDKMERATGETVRMADGKVLLRDFIPLSNEEGFAGLLWTYTDITRHTHTEELEIQQTVNYFLSSLYNQDTVDGILWDVARNCIGRLGFTDCVIYLVNEAAQCLEQKAAWGEKTDMDNRIINPIRIPLGKGIVGTVALTGKAELIADTTLDPRYIVDDAPRQAEISVPIIAENRVIGVIDSEHPDKHFFTDKHLSILTAIASLCAIKIVQLESTLTQRREMERQKLFYEEILNNLPADIAVFDNEHRYLFVNPTGIKDPVLRNWIIGKKDEDYCDLRNKPYSIFQERRGFFNRVIEQRTQIEWEEMLKDANGAVSYHLRKFYPVPDEHGVPKLVIGYGLNITERRKIEEQIRQSEKKYRDLFNNNPALIFTHDLDFRIHSVNAAANKVLGYSEAYLTGKRLGELMFGPSQAEPLRNYMDAIRNDGQVNGLLPVERADGSQIHLLFHGYKVEPENGSAYVIVFGQDISDRIRIEEDLYRAKMQSEKNAQAKESFLAKVSHEIRTPMNGILGVADLLSNTNPDEQQQRYINVLKMSAQNLLAIVNDVLDIEKILAGKMLLEEIVFDLQKTVDLLRDIFSSEAALRNNKFSIVSELEPGIQFTGDPFRISQVLGNLLSNAVKFTQSGKIILRISRVSDDAQSSRISFRVEDNGIGIPADKLNEIFEPFSQVDYSAASGVLGTGLGLTICREIATLMNGSLTVESKLDKGSVFTFTVPLRKTESSSPVFMEIKKENNKKLDGYRILLVEDMELNLFIVQEMMRDWELYPEIARDGEEAVKMSELEKYDLILMDIQMPVMNGVEATLRIRSDKANPNHQTPIVALSANAFESDKESYFQAGMNAVLSKPFDAEKLYSLLTANLLQQDSAKAVQPSPVNPSAPAPAEVKIDLTYLLRIGKNNRGFVGMMLQSFRDSATEIIGEMEQSLEKKDWPRIAQLVHKLKFALNVMGAGSLDEEVKWIETNTKQPKTELENEMQVRIYAFITVIRELYQHAGELLESGEWS
jgi:PAS domain S-box-containing protein